MEILQKHEALLTNYEVHLLLRDIAKQESEIQRRGTKASVKAAKAGANQQKNAASRDSEKQQACSSGTEGDEAPKRSRSESQSAAPESTRKKHESVHESERNVSEEKEDRGETSESLAVSQYQAAPNLATICYELQRYLDDVTDCAVLERRNVDAAAFQSFNNALREKFALTRTERFAIANWLPATPIDIAALIEDAERRFANEPEQLEELVSLVRTHLTGSAEEHAAMKSEIERERTALKEPAVKTRSPRKPH